MVLKFIEWYFTVGSIATLLSCFASYLIGRLEGYYAALGRISPDENDELTEEELRIVREPINFVESMILAVLVWPYSMPLLVTQVYQYLVKFIKKMRS